MSDQQPVDDLNTGKPADFNHLEDSRRSYFRIKRKLYTIGCLSFPVTCLGLFLMILDPASSSLWFGINCTAIPVFAAVAFQCFRSLRALLRRKRELHTAISTGLKDWIPDEAAIVATELEWLARGRIIATAIFITGFILIIGILITGTPKLLLGAGIGLSVAGGLLLSAYLIIEMHTKEYAYRLEKGR